MQIDGNKKILNSIQWILPFPSAASSRFHSLRIIWSPNNYSHQYIHSVFQQCCVTIFPAISLRREFCWSFLFQFQTVSSLGATRNKCGSEGCESLNVDKILYDIFLYFDLLSEKSAWYCLHVEKEGFDKLREIYVHKIWIIKFSAHLLNARYYKVSDNNNTTRRVWRIIILQGILG